MSEVADRQRFSSHNSELHTAGSLECLLRGPLCASAQRYQLSGELYHYRSIVPRSEAFTYQLNHPTFLNLLPY